jgi:tetratricopeptide (TPR) repeat protein
MRKAQQTAMASSKQKRPDNSLRSLLLGVCALGLALSLALAGALYFMLFSSGFSRDSRRDGAFYDLLKEYDGALAAGNNDKKLAELLDKLEKKAPDAGTRLSVLKRRRALALEDVLTDSYRAALNRAVKAFPFSQPLAALAAERILADNPELQGAAAAELAACAPVLTDRPLLAFACYALAGELESPENAAALPRGERLFAAVIPLLRGGEQARLITDLAILRLLGGDVQEAAVLIDSLLASVPAEGTIDEAYQFAAEFLYDYGDPLEAARLFARMPGEKNLGRQGDALVLAGYKPRNVWLSLISPDRKAAENGTENPLLMRAFYNLASSAAAREEKLSYLEQLISRSAEAAGDEGITFGIIRYTRLFDGPRAAAVLEGLDRANNGLLDLEWYRRRRDEWSLERSLAETWLLVGRHPEDSRIYRWGAYYFDYNHRYDDTAALLQNAAYNHIEGPWIGLHEGIRLIREGQLEAGEARLRSIPSAPWQVPANLARILEARRAVAAALESYETAASLAGNPKDAAAIQLRIARCLRALGRDGEIRRVLHYALDLDPDNLKVRLELHRLDTLGL